MIKYLPVYTMLLIFVFCTSCGQSQSNVPKDYIKPQDIVTSYGPTQQMVRNIKKGRNGTLLIAGSNSTSFGDVFRFDGKSFTNLTSKLGSHRFWDVLEDRRGGLWFTSIDSGIYYYNWKSFQHFTTRDGLPSNQVMPVYEDKAGIIWLGTGGGLSRYDSSLPDGQGKPFRNFTTKDGLPNNNITTIMEDRTGKLWLGTKGDACFYDGKTFTVFKNKDGEAFYNVGSIMEDRKGDIWFGGSIIKDRKKISDKGTILTVESGLWRYDGSTYTKVSQRGASAIIEDKKGNIWTTGNGKVCALSRYDQKSLYNKKAIVTEIMSGPPAFLGLLEASDGSIWFGALGGVFRYDGKTVKRL